MKKFNILFIRGLVTLLPIVATIYLALWLIMTLDGLLGTFLRLLLPNNFYFPGLGLFLSLSLIFIVGLLTENFFTKKILTNIEHRLKEIPIIKAIYSPLKDLANLFSNESQKKMKSVVLVEVMPNSKMLGLVTRETFEDLPFSETDQIAVYIPMSYMLGGITMLVNRSQIKELDLPIDKAMKLAITGWVTSSDKSHNGQ